MSRDLSSDMALEVVKPGVMPIMFAEFEFDSGEIQLWNGVGDLAWDGKTFTGMGNLVGISPYNETEDLQSQGLTFLLTGIPSDLIAIALEEQYQNRPCHLWLGFFDQATNAVIGDPYLLFSGLMDTMDIDDDGQTGAIKLNCENVIFRLTQNKQRNYTSEDQKARFPTDTGFDFIPALQNKNIVWQAKL